MCIMKQKSNLIARIKELFAETKMEDYTAVSNEIIRCLGDFAVGTKVVQVVGGEETTLPDGNYPLDNGKSIVVESGEIKEITDYPKEEMGEEIPSMTDEEEMADEYKNEIMTKLVDGTEVKILSKGEAASVGDMVLVKSGEEFVKAPEGQHELEGGLVIEVNAEGYIDELKTKEVEKVDEEGISEEMKTMFEAVETLKSMIDGLETTIAEMKIENTELKSNFQKFSKAPSTESITKKQQNNSVLTSKYEKAKNIFGR